MKYYFLVAQRYLLTFLVKLTAEAAKIMRFWWLVSLLDWLLKKRGETLGKECVHCMNITRKWQNRAKKCVFAHHEYEKETKREL